LSLYWIVATLSACAYSPDDPKSVGGTGGISGYHERVGPEKYMLRVEAAPGILETEGSMKQRILIFANEYAADQCQGNFTFVQDESLAQAYTRTFMERSRLFVFECSK